jgi:putative ABC transport system ATP-binding protein
VTKPDPVIKISNLTVRFGDKTLFQDFSLEVASGERVLLTGESGKGKSTLLKCLLGFTIPNEGTILIDGVPMNEESIWRLRTRFAYVPQEPELGDNHLREWFEQPFSYKANAHLKENLVRLPELMARFSLSPSLLDAGIETLSGGEKQRAALIAALLMNRDILLLDEPTSALDKKNSQAVTSYLRSLDGVTILGTSHDHNFSALADRTIPFPPNGV